MIQLRGKITWLSYPLNARDTRDWWSSRRSWGRSRCPSAPSTIVASNGEAVSSSASKTKPETGRGQGSAAQHGACQGMAQSSLGKSCHALWVLTRRDTSWLLLGRLGWAFVLPAFALSDGRSELSGWPFIKISPCLYSHKWWGRNFCLLLIRLIKAAFSPFSSLNCSLP